MAIPSGLLVKVLAPFGVVGLALAGDFTFKGPISSFFRENNNIPADKVSELNTKIKDTLSFPEECKFGESGKENPKVCSLTSEQLKTINFKNKTEGKELQIEGSADNLKVEIKWIKESERANYKDTSTDLIFIFKGYAEELKIKVKDESDDASAITLKANTDTVFVIKDNKLEKAWTVTTLAEKVGLTCPSVTGDSAKKCTAKKGTIKFSTDSAPTIKDLILSADVTDKITYSENEAEYNQGFKFTVGTEAVTGTGAAAGSGEEKLEANSNYEVKYDATNGWYLSKKTS